jgi:hypothetical protein
MLERVRTILRLAHSLVNEAIRSLDFGWRNASQVKSMFLNRLDLTQLNTKKQVS